jgi:hypothetical protein
MSAPDLDALKSVLVEALDTHADLGGGTRIGPGERRWPSDEPVDYERLTYGLTDLDAVMDVEIDLDAVALTIHSTVAAPLLARIAELEADIVDLEEDLMTAESRILCGSRSVDQAIQELQEARRYDLRRDGDA